MKAEALRDKDSKALEAELHKLFNEQFKLKMQYGIGQLTKNHLLNNVRKDIARVKTVMSELAIGEAK